MAFTVLQLYKANYMWVFSAAAVAVRNSSGRKHLNLYL